MTTSLARLTVATRAQCLEAAASSYTIKAAGGFRNGIPMVATRSREFRNSWDWTELQSVRTWPETGLEGRVPELGCDYDVALARCVVM